MQFKTGIIDYGSGNFGSVFNAVRSITHKIQVITSEKDFELCDRIILPGVGAFHHAVSQLASLNILDRLLKDILVERKIFLGICVGMQILAEKGYEFQETIGLKIVKGKVDKFNFSESQKLRLPHIGWNSVFNFNGNPLFEGIEEVDNDFYFVNSYHLYSDDSLVKFQYTNYGYNFISALYKENIFGVQFHPEKSQHNGPRLLKNFIEYA